MYSSTKSRSSLAARVHFSRTLALPRPHHRLVFDELAGPSFLERLLYLTDKPFLVIEVTLNRLIDHPCALAADFARKTVDALQGAAIHADCSRFLSIHIQQEYTRIRALRNPGNGPNAPQAASLNPFPKLERARFRSAILF